MSKNYLVLLNLPSSRTLLAHRRSYIESQKVEQPPISPVKTLAQPAKSPSSSPSSVRKNSSSTRTKRQAPPPPSNGNNKSRTKSETKEQVVKRDRSTESSTDVKDNRYSLQVDSSANDSDQFRHRFGSLPRKSAPAPPNRRDSLSRENTPSSNKPPQHPSSPQKSKTQQQVPDLQSTSTFNPATNIGRRYSENIYTGGTLPPGSSPPRQRSFSSSSRGSQTLDTRKRTNSGSSGGSPRFSRSRSSSKEYMLQPTKVELPKNFTKSDGAELVESIRKSTAVNYRKTLLAVNGVLQFLKEKVPLCADMVDGLMSAVHESQASLCPISLKAGL